jgi:hypothetical protein
MQKYACPCCGYKTIYREDTFYDLCPVCFWETDPIQLADPHYKGGANRPSLVEAQHNFIVFGACEKDVFPYVRMPLVDEKKDENWLPFAPNTEGGNKSIIETFTAKKIHLAGWHIGVYNTEVNSFTTKLIADETLISATLDHRFTLDLSFENREEHFPKNGLFLLQINEGHTGIHYFIYMNWDEAAAATQQFIDEITEVNKTVNVKKAEEEKAFYVRVNIDNQIVMSKLTTWRNMDWDVEKFRNIQIEIKDETYSIIDTFTDFENMLLVLQKSMPKNYKIETCFFCRFSSYNPVGNDNFGALDCFKNCKKEFEKVDAKHALFALHKKKKAAIFKVEETHYCADFQPIKTGDWVYKHIF